MEPKVTLINWTPNVLETIWVLWEQSKSERDLLAIVQEAAKLSETSPHTLEDLFWQVIAQKIPVGENIHFTFVIEGVSISWREQAVRHRIGVKVGERVGVDFIPDLATSSWWSQSMRIQNMGAFADNGQYRLPESFKDKKVRWMNDVGEEGEVPLAVLYSSLMRKIQSFYNAAVNVGVPLEDAREAIPLSAQHRISWDLNLTSLLHILGERGCWILQMPIWGPIIKEMVNELATKVHPMFRRILQPPCVKGGKFQSCLYKLENSRRLTKDDPHPPCPLHLVRDDVLANVEPIQLKRASGLKDGTINVPMREQMLARAEEYRKLWGHDPFMWDESRE